MTNFSNVMIVIPGLILSIGSLFFIMLLLVSYFSKQKLISIKNKLYKLLLITVVALLVTEIITTLYYSIGNSKILYYILIRVHWYTGIIWFFLLYLYSICFLKNIEIDSIKELIKTNVRCKLFLIFTIVYSIGYLFVPFSLNDIYNFTYLPGLATYYMLLYGVITVILIIGFMFNKAHNATTRKKITTIVMIIEMIIITGLQYFIKHIAFFGIGSTLQMFFLYFNIENPDLYIINELETIKTDIDKSNRAKSDFLSNMSHEIRSPMNAIVGFSSSLMNNPNFNEEAAKADIKNIAQAGNSLLDIINNILDISKIESGKEVLEEKEYSLSNIVKELTSIIENRLKDKPVELIVDVDKNLPNKLYGDSTKLFQVLLNILTNSVKYTEVGKIKLYITGDIIGDKVNLKYKISDTGYGIKKEDYDKLFEKFSRLENATKNEIEGTGLGLAITKTYVNLMGGKIWFESEYEVGTSFYIELTQKIIDKTPIGDITSKSDVNNAIDYFDCSKYKILIVDDNKLNLKVAERLLSKYNFNIETIESGKECIYKIKEGHHYDMIFLDHMMPEMDGIETLNILRKLEDYEIPPVVALTANAITGMKEKYLDAGFDEYLPKPINVQELNKIIKKYFK